MRILICEPGKTPVVSEIPHTLEAMQAVVGGCIQAIYPWREPVALVCDDEGLIKDYPFNRSVADEHLIFGTFFICGMDEHDFSDMPASLIERYTDELRIPELLVRTPFGLAVVPIDSDQ